MRCAVAVDMRAWSSEACGEVRLVADGETSGRSWNTMSWSSPPIVMSHARCRSVALFLNPA
jgi:hypothetical protein